MLKKRFLYLFMLINILIMQNVFASTIIGTVIDKDGVNIRSGAGTNYNKTGYLAYGKSVTLVSDKKFINSDIKEQKECAYWYQVYFNNNTKWCVIARKKHILVNLLIAYDLYAVNN